MSQFRVFTVLAGCILLTFGLSYLVGHYNEIVSSFVNFKDYSGYGGEYSLLRGISIKAKSVNFDHTEKAKVLGTNLQFSVFKVIAPVYAQTYPIVEQHGVYKTFVGYYTISVAPDPTDKARLTLLRQIKAHCEAEIAGDLRDYEVFALNKFLWSNGIRYVLYSAPVGELEGSTYLLYSSGKIIRVTFDGFAHSEQGAGGLSQFIYDDILFNYPEAQIRCVE